MSTLTGLEPPPGNPPADMFNPHHAPDFVLPPIPPPGGSPLPPGAQTALRVAPEAKVTPPGTVVRFYLENDPRTDAFDNALVNPDGSTPVVELIDVYSVNDNKSILTQIVTDWHRYKEYPREYAAFKQGVDMRNSGFAIRDWKGDNSRAKMLEGWNIFTVEQLAATADSICMSIGPGTMDLRNAAKAFLQVQRDSAVAEKAMAENDALRRQLAEQGSQIANLVKMQNSMMAKQGASEVIEEHPAEIDPLASPAERTKRPYNRRTGQE